MFNADWFTKNNEHSLIGTSGNPEPHIFFDVKPDFSADNRYVNVVVTTPGNSEHNYQVDLISGQRHYAYSYCDQMRPPFSIGHIPRMLDQLGSPQKVIVFGDAKTISKLVNYNHFRVRLVGAYVERVCLEGDCGTDKNWLSRLVFIGVNPEDKAYANVLELPDLLKKHEWPQLQATIEGMDGKNTSGLKSFPYITAGEPLLFQNAFDFFKTHSIYMNEGEITKVQKGCHALYEKLWTEVGVDRPEDRPVKTMEELNAKIKLREELRKKKLPVGFEKRFHAFTLKYYDEAVTCNKFVYAGNMNHRPEKFWFLNQVQLFYRLHRDGYFYDCHHQSWQRNTLDNRGNYNYNIKQGIGECDVTDIDKGMAYISNFLGGLKNESDEYYRFIDYDNHVFGTHRKLYSWTKIPSKKFACGIDPNIKIKQEMSVFPEDIQWKPRKVKDYESDMKIIY